MTRLANSVRLLLALCNVAVRRPWVLVYPVLASVVTFGLFGLVAAGSLLGLETVGPIPTSIAVSAGWILGSVLVVAVFASALTYEVRGLYAGERVLPFAGLLAVWRKRRRLLRFVLVVATVGVVLYVTTERTAPLLHELWSDTLRAFAAGGLVFAFQVVVFGDEEAPVDVERFEQAWGHRRPSLSGVQPPVTACLVGVPVCGFALGWLGVEIPPFGVLTPALGVVVGPVLGVALGMALDWVGKTALYVVTVTGAVPEMMVIDPRRVVTFD